MWGLAVLFSRETGPLFPPGPGHLKSNTCCSREALWALGRVGDTRVCSEHGVPQK